MSYNGAALGAARCLRATDKAILITFDDFPDDEIWIPKSQIHDDSEVFAEGHKGELVVMSWYAEKQGWL